ncbi:hypothetical protein [Pseudomonas sp. PDM20]|uniref:hypothetical protein n=1 Tax=Pseudomonas sp. PDM20 TaxID=2769254 RepID=UPI001781DD02|nr:hypothetical protein [Pseudomonas sp. PDM20]MBD9685035.1 hypothetical protein [Pseudomonas sp. PDM20]
MSWKTAVIGSESPSKERLAWVLCMYFALGMFGYGAITDFVPAPVWQSIGAYIAAAITAIAMFVFLVNLALGRVPLKSTNSFWRKWLAVLALPLFLYFVVWLGVVRGAADLYSRLVGRAMQVEAVLTKERVHSRRACDYRLVGPVLRAVWPDYLCVGAEQFEALPVTAQYRLVGRTSSLGFHVDEIRTSSGELVR